MKAFLTLGIAVISLLAGILSGYYLLPREPICPYPQPSEAKDIVGIDEAIAYLTTARDSHWYLLTGRTLPGYTIYPEKEREWVRRYQAIINLLEEMRDWFPYERVGTGATD